MSSCGESAHQKMVRRFDVASRFDDKNSFCWNHIGIRARRISCSGFPTQLDAPPNEDNLRDCTCARLHPLEITIGAFDCSRSMPNRSTPVLKVWSLSGT